MANDLETIHGDKHQGILIDRSGNYHTLTTKQAIANTIKKEVIKKWKN